MRTSLEQYPIGRCQTGIAGRSIFRDRSCVPGMFGFVWFDRYLSQFASCYSPSGKARDLSRTGISRSIGGCCCESGNRVARRVVLSPQGRGSFSGEEGELQTGMRYSRQVAKSRRSSKPFSGEVVVHERGISSGYAPKPEVEFPIRPPRVRGKRVRLDGFQVQ